MRKKTHIDVVVLSLLQKKPNTSASVDKSGKKEVIDASLNKIETKTEADDAAAPPVATPVKEGVKVRPSKKDTKDASSPEVCL